MSQQPAPRSKPIAPRRDPCQFAPLFVLAPARSYTSVVVTMIGQHPDLAGLPELKLFSYRTIGELGASLPTYWIEKGFAHRSPGLVRALAQFEFGGQTVEGLTAAQSWLRQREHWSGANVLDVILARLAPRHAVEKSPENVATAAALRRLACAYPNARYLHLTRNPLTTQASTAKHLLATIPEHPRLGEPMAGIAAWNDTHARILRFAATLPADRVMRVRAEDVLNDAPAQLRAIAAWLSLRTDDAAIDAMRHPEASPFASFGPAGSGIVGGHDHDFLRDPIPHQVAPPPPLQPPSGWHGEPRLWRRTVKIAQQLGYGDGSARSRRRSLQKGPAIDPEALRDELLRRRDLDQAARSAYTGAPVEMARLMEMDSDNTAWLMATVKHTGWPGHSMVGEDGAHAAWLLAQHADMNPTFQRRCLELLQDAVERGEASAAELAHLTNRVLQASGQARLHGARVIGRDGKLPSAWSQNPRNVDSRRAAVSLDPLALKLGRASVRRRLPKSARSPCPSCGELIDVWLPAPGQATRFRCLACGATGAVRARRRVGPPFASI
ncbi:MAG: sulfotransferase [Deltaproteobacteria bacterium]|nr:sulfotransferase [Deltaproteobacteria bacterium]